MILSHYNKIKSHDFRRERVIDEFNLLSLAFAIWILFPLGHRRRQSVVALQGTATEYKKFAELQIVSPNLQFIAK